MANLTKRPVNFRVLRELERRTGVNREYIQRYEEITKKNVELQTLQTINLINLLNSLGISKDRVYPSYQTGGEVRQITNDRYTFDFQIPEDTIGKNLFLEQDIPLENLIPDRSRDTLLSLRLERQLPDGHKEAIPSPWGYRNEVNVNIGTKENPRFVDIGTLERFAWKPVYDRGNIIGLTDTEDIVSIGAVGLERLCMVANRLEKVQDVDYIKPFYDSFKIGEKTEIAGESLRALHRIYSDMKTYSLSLGRQKLKRVNRLIRNVLSSGLSIREIGNLLKINADNQPWHQELVQGIEPTRERIERYAKSE
jgi:transcriptional regulator with XRE-family HTH domain